MTQAEVAELVAEHVWRHHGQVVAIDRKYLSRLESGEVRWPNTRYREALRAVLGAVEDRDLGFWPTGGGSWAPRPAAQDAGVQVERRQLIAAAATAGGRLFLGLPGRRRLIGDVLGRAGRVDRAIIEDLRALLQDLREADDTSPDRSLLVADARGLVAVAEELLVNAPSSLQAELGKVAAEAAMLLWWLLTDAGRDARAEYEHAMALAVEWRHPRLIGHLLGWRGGLSLARGDLATAVRLARTARDRRWSLTAAANGWAADYEVRAHIRAGEAELARRVLDEVEESYAGVDPATEPPWLYWLNGTVLDLNLLDVRLLRNGPDAVPALEVALENLPSDRQRDVAWYRTHIAATFVRAGEAERGVLAAERAILAAGAAGTTWAAAELRHLVELPAGRSLAIVLADLVRSGRLT